MAAKQKNKPEETPSEASARVANSLSLPEATAKKQRANKDKVDHTNTGSGPVTVVATQAGYYDSVYRLPGQQFVLKDRSYFSENWMEEVGADTD